MDRASTQFLCAVLLYCFAGLSATLVLLFGATLTAAIPTFLLFSGTGVILYQMMDDRNLEAPGGAERGD